jgi:Flp pilus assembly protein TadB
MFIQLLRLAKHDSSTTPLFTDLLEKIENHLEMDRKNKSALTGERLLALFMTLIPIPAILIMSRVVPETMYFLTEVTIGRMITMLSFASMLVWIIIDKIVGRAEI